MKRVEAWMWSIFVVGIIGVCIWGIVELISAGAQIAAAIVGVAGTVVAAVVRHGFELDKQRRHTEFLEKQENYKELLSKVGDFARQKEGAADLLTTAHLASWAFGDLPVLEATNKFQKQRTKESLFELLGAIRKSLQESGLPDDFEQKYDATVLFPSTETTNVQTGLK